MPFDDGDESARTQAPMCRCRDKKQCPLPGKCETASVVYEATIATQSEKRTYIGSTAGTLKDRFTQHKSNCNLPHKRSTTKLSSYVWDLKDQKKPFKITWRILKHAKAYSPSSKRCNLCSWEKVHIMLAGKNNLNAKSELIGKCRHRRKYLLSEYGRG